MKEKLKDRFLILGALMLIATFVLLTQLFNLQIAKGKYYDDISQGALLRERGITAPRGNIIDRNGVPIALNRTGYNINLVKTKMTQAEFNSMLLKLIQIFEKNNDGYFQNFKKILTFNPMEFGQYLIKNDDKVKWLKNNIGLDFKGISASSSPLEIFNYLKKKYELEAYSDEEAYKIISLRYETLGFSVLNPVVLAKDVSNKTLAEIEESNNEFPGVTFDVDYMRKYIDGQLAAHIIGYMGNLDENDYKKLQSEGYKMNDLLGKTGVEKAAEKYLRGIEGKKKEEVDTKGRQTGQISEQSSIPGNDVMLTIDMKLQKVAMESLERNINEIKKNPDYRKNYGDANAGSLVAIDVRSGEILAMASYPSYDPSLFVTNAENKEAQKQKAVWLLDSENKPMLNRTIREIYAPGSTYKPITAIAGLETGVINKDTRINDDGRVNLGGKDFFCLEFRDYGWSHGSINLKDALKTSCNIFFHKLGVETGIDNIDKWAKLFGLGEKTGIDVDSNNEEKGIRANIEYKLKTFKDDWRPADTAQASIGQIYNSFTPLQLANYVATISNGGKKFKPYLIKRIVKYDNSIITETSPEFDMLPVKKETLDAVKEGMVAVANANDGTAVEAFRNFGFPVAGKTGTAETGNASRSSNALFVCYAPADDPQIAVAVVVEKGVWGSNTAPIARDVMAEYFKLNSKVNTDDKAKAEEIILTH